MESPDENGFAPLHFAAACESTEPLEVLIHKSANTSENIKGEKRNALFVAIMANKPENVRMLLQYDKFLLYDKDSHAALPIHFAAKLGRTECIRIMYKVDKSIANIEDGFRKFTAVTYAAAYDQTELLEVLLNELNGHVNSLDKWNRIPLTYAARNGNLKAAAILIRQYALSL